MVTYNLVLDGEKIETMAEGQERDVSVPIGRHDLQMRYSWLSSPVVSVDVKENDTVSLVCRSGGSPAAALAAFVYRPRQYILLRVGDTAFPAESPAAASVIAGGLVTAFIGIVSVVVMLPICLILGLTPALSAALTVGVLFASLGIAFICVVRADRRRYVANACSNL
jgi:hypothetical protein